MCTRTIGLHPYRIDQVATSAVATGAETAFAYVGFVVRLDVHRITSISRFRVDDFSVWEVRASRAQCASSLGA